MSNDLGLSGWNPVAWTEFARDGRPLVVSRLSEDPENPPLTSHVYDDAGRVESITHADAGGAQLAGVSYTYKSGDALGLVDTQTQVLALPGEGGWEGGWGQVLT